MMFLVHFTHPIRQQSIQYLKQIIEYLTEQNMLVRYSASTLTAKIFAERYFSNVVLNPNLFDLERDANTLIRYVIHIDKNPSELLQHCADAVVMSKLITFMRVKDLWMYLKDVPRGHDIDFSFIASGASYKTLQAASKLEVTLINSDATEADLKTKMLFLAYRLEIRQMDVRQL
jgi:hypothetical protein